MKNTLPRTLSICSVIPAAAGCWFLWKFNASRLLAADPNAEKIAQTIHATRAQIQLISAGALFTLTALSLLLALWIRNRQKRKALLEESAPTP
jgi:hypothetical protein